VKGPGRGVGGKKVTNGIRERRGGEVLYGVRKEGETSEQLLH